jgi:hypothetical protein
MFDIVKAFIGSGRDALNGRFVRPLTAIDLHVRSLTKGVAA